MTDAIVDRLNAALEGRYRLDRKLGEGSRRWGTEDQAEN